MRLDANGIPCGKGWISKEKECRVGNTRLRSVKSPQSPRFQLDNEIVKNAGMVGLGTAIALGVTSGAVYAGVRRERKLRSLLAEKETLDKARLSFAQKKKGGMTVGVLGRDQQTQSLKDKLSQLQKERDALMGERDTLEAVRIKAVEDKEKRIGQLESQLVSIEKRGQSDHVKDWKPTMTAKEAEDWVVDSAYTDTVYHATGLEGERGIKKTGFLLSKRKIGRIYGDGVYVTTNKEDAEYYRSKNPVGAILPLKVNARRILDVDKVLEYAERNGIDVKKVDPKIGDDKPELKTMRLAAIALGKEGEYELARKQFQKDPELKRDKGLGTAEARAFEKVLRDEGFDGLKLTGASFRKPLMVVFDPQRLTVIGDQQEDYEFSKSRKREKDYAPDINGIPLVSTSFPDFSKISDVVTGEPPFPPGVSGKNRKSGITVVEPDGRVWLMKNRGAYGGEFHSNPRGGAEKGLTDQQNALKEAKEELGLDVKIIGYMGDFNHHTGKPISPGDSYKAVTRQYIGVRTGGSPWDAGEETERVKLSTIQSAQQLVDKNKKRDQAEILKTFEGYWADGNKQEMIQRYFPQLRADADGIPCGKGWISKDKECRIVAGAAIGGGLLAVGVIAAIAATAKTSESHAKQAIENGAKLTAGISETHAKQVTKNRAKLTAKTKLKSDVLSKQNTEEYLKLREGYRSNFADSAKEALRLSDGIITEDIPEDKKQITIPVGGFAKETITRTEDVFAYELGQILGDDHAIVKHRNTSFNKSDGGKANDPKYVLNKMLRYGKNPESIKLASEVIAYQKKYPDKKINLVGHSAGGLIIDEANHLIQLNGYSNRTLNLGTLWFGITDAIGDYKGIVDSEDPKLIPTAPGSISERNQTSNSYPPKTKKVKTLHNNNKGGKGSKHWLKHYIKSPEIRAEIFDTLNGERWDSFNFDADGIPCGEGWISKDKECRLPTMQGGRINTPAIPAASGLQVGAAMGGVVAGSASVAAAYGISRINKGHLSNSQLSLVTQEQANKITPDRTKPKIEAGVTGVTNFVKDADGREYVMKEVTLPVSFLQGSADVTASEIGLDAGIKVNQVALMPAKVNHPMKKGGFGATLHALVPGKATKGLPKGHKYAGLRLDQREGIKSSHIKAMGKHPDLAKMTALDTFVGNWDRNGGNIFYDDKKDAFWGIDMGIAFEHKMYGSDSLAKRSRDNLKKMDVSKLSSEERQGLRTYADTLRTLQQRNPPDATAKRWMNYIRKEKGDWKLLRRYNGVVSIEDNYRETGKLIKHLDKELSRFDSIEKDLYIAVKNSIQSAYGEFSGFPVIHKDNLSSISSITGVFRDGTELFDYEITSDNLLSYVESSRSDSYLVGFSIDSGLISHFRNDAAKNKKQCKEGKPCGNTCVAKGYKCRVRLGVRQRSALTQVRLALQGNPVTERTQNILTNPRYQQGLAIAGVTTVASAAVLGGAVMMIKNDLKRSSVDFDSIRQPPGGIPDAQTLAKYDTFVPGQLIRKNFRDEGKLGTRQHYGVYVGKNQDTGHHMVVDTGENWKSRDREPIVQMRGLTWNVGANDSEWDVVPEEEMYQTKNAKKLSQEEVLDRANRMLYQKFRYQGFSSNCEAFARGIVEDDAYSAQGQKVTPLTRVVSGVVTDNVLSLRTSIRGQMNQYETQLADMKMQGKSDSPEAKEAQRILDEMKIRLKVTNSENERTIAKLGGTEIAGLSDYARDKYKMNAQQMVEELKKQKVMEERRKWDELLNPYTGNPEPGPTKGKISQPKTLAQITDEMNISIDPNYKAPMRLADVRKKLEESFKLPAAKRDADEVELMPTEAVDFFLNSLGLRTPKQLEEAIDAVASEFPSLKKAIAQQIVSDYLLTLFAVLTQDN